MKLARLSVTLFAAVLLTGCVGTVGLYGILKPPADDCVSTAQELEKILPEENGG